MILAVVISLGDERLVMASRAVNLCSIEQLGSCFTNVSPKLVVGVLSLSYWSMFAFLLHGKSPRMPSKSPEFSLTYVMTCSTRSLLSTIKDSYRIKFL